MQITERFKPISLDFGFADGDRSFSCEAVNNNNKINNNNNNGNFICVFECTIVNLATYRQFTNAA